MHVPRTRLAIAVSFTAASVWQPAPANAYDGCLIANSAPVVTNLFGTVYIERARTSGRCVPENDADPYVCFVHGSPYGGLAAPDNVVGAGTYVPVEQYCEASSTLAVSLENCQEWFVLGEYRTGGFRNEYSSFEMACA